MCPCHNSYPIHTKINLHALLAFERIPITGSKRLYVIEKVKNNPT
jgi:hypothetical protein